MQVKEDTPPTFLVHANDDNDVPAENSLMMYAALREKKIPAELHILSEGGHGFGLASNNQHIANFRNVFIYRNICDKGWDYEMGFNFKPDEVEAALKKRDFIAAENLFESEKKNTQPYRAIQRNGYEYLPPHNQMGAPLYRNEKEFDFVPEKLPAVKASGFQWKYQPSFWFGAFEPSL